MGTVKIERGCAVYNFEGLKAYNFGRILNYFGFYLQRYDRVIWSFIVHLFMKMLPFQEHLPGVTQYFSLVQVIPKNFMLMG